MDDCFKKAQKPWVKILTKVNKTKLDYHNACKAERSAANQERNATGDNAVSPEQVCLYLFNQFIVLILSFIFYGFERFVNFRNAYRRPRRKCSGRKRNTKQHCKRSILTIQSTWKIWTKCLRNASKWKHNDSSSLKTFYSTSTKEWTLAKTPCESSLPVNEIS